MESLIKPGRRMKTYDEIETYGKDCTLQKCVISDKNTVLSMVLTCVSCKRVVHRGCSGIPEYQFPFFDNEHNDFTCYTCVANDFGLYAPDPFEERNKQN